jgi:hypothetical protein
MNKKPQHLTVASLVILSTFLVFTAGLVSVSTLTGCRTVNSTNQVDIATIGAAIKGVSRTATLYAIRKEPKSTNYLTSLQIYGSSFLTNTSLDPAALNTFIQSLPFKQISTPEAQLGISTILTAYEIFWIRHPMPPVDRNKEFIKYYEAILEGVRLGLLDSRQLTQ